MCGARSPTLRSSITRKPGYCESESSIGAPARSPSVPVARDLASCTLASDSSSAGPCGPKVSGLDQTYPEAISCRKDASRNFT
jgi:hypothetical protein